MVAGRRRSDSEPASLRSMTSPVPSVAVLRLLAILLPAAVVATEAGAFLTGALTDFAGVSAIEALTKKAAPAPS